MASVDECFTARVEKVFGSLSSSQSLSSPWSLTDDEVEKREWWRHKDEPNRDDRTPCSSSFDGFFRKSRRKKNSPSNRQDGPEDPNDDVDCSRQSFNPGDAGDDRDEWEIRSSIGLDCTLDNEEEEDEYDKVAEGREDIGERLYMRDVNDHGPYLNSHNVLLPTSIHVVVPRANSYAAQIFRLKEDDEVVAAAGKLDSPHTSDDIISMSSDDYPPPPMIAAASSAGSVKPKSILKRKDNEATVKSTTSKRVKFDPACKDDFEEEENHGSDLAASVNDSSSLASKVPDYVVMNPSKYVRCSFDEEEPNDGQALMDDFLLKPMKRPKSIIKLDDDDDDAPMPIMFIPRIRKKTSEEAKAVICSSSTDVKRQNHGGPGIAAGEVVEEEENEVGQMEEEDDEPETDSTGAIAGSRKPRRCYRSSSSKSSEEDSIC